MDTPAFPTGALGNIRVNLEEGIAEEAAGALRKRGHLVLDNVGGHMRAIFGRGQIIKREPSSGVLCGGSDPRGDGQVLAW